MRSFLRRTIIAGCCLGTGLAWSGCKAKPATEYVAGISTQVTVPRDLKVIRVDVAVGGVPQICNGYKVYNGVVQLPRSLGAYPKNDSSLSGSGPITYTIIGFTEDIDTQGANPLFSVCAAPTVGADGARVLRRSRQPYIPDEIRFLPMPLKFACYDKNCEGEGMTCKGGKCVSAELSLDQAKEAFPPYSPELVDGTGGACFSTTTCMAAAAPVVPVDQENCVYAVPNTPSAPAPILGANPFNGPSSGDGVNVEVTYDGGLTREVLDLDAEEGFSIPDPAFPQRFKLAPGLCEMVKGIDDQNKPTTHRITNIRTSGTCQSKRLAQPICADDALKAMGLDPNGQVPNPPPADVCASVELKPPQAALIVVVDKTTAHEQFFVGLNKTLDLNDQDTLVEPAIKAALSDPAFQRTDIGLVYASTAPAACTPPAPNVAPGPASTTRDSILASLKAEPRVPGPVALASALEGAYTELKLPKYDSYFRRAVLVMGNNGFDDDKACLALGNPATRATSARADATKPIDTYVMQLTKDPGPNKQPGAEALAAAGGTGTSAYKVEESKDKFQSIVNSLGTCVYDVNDDAAQPKETDIVSFSDPLTNAKTDVTFNAACNTDDVPGDGWGYAAGGNVPAGKKRIYLCANQCTTYRNVLKAASLFTAVYGQPPLPIPIFAYRAACLAP